ncbi:MAG: hypothetical protein U0163_12165 [Gemmatimonadaceae bacterium]
MRHAEEAASDDIVEDRTRDAIRASRARRRALAVISSQSPRRAWRAAQGMALFGLTAAGLGLLAFPDQSLRILWNAVIPLLPLSFLLVPSAWRSVCPLASLNMMASGIGDRRLSPDVYRLDGALGMAFLGLLVPARHFALNTGATALLTVLIACALVAAAAGVMYDAKAGFCNAICPILPVERLYGQSPLFSVGNPRCLPCTLCTPRGCIDLTPSKSITQVLGPARRSMAWLASSFGVFATSFPGFVFGYFQVRDTTAAHALAVYAAILGSALVSCIIWNLVIRLWRISSNVALPALAALSASVYYWYATPASLSAMGASPLVGTAVRYVLVAGVVVWGMVAVTPGFRRRPSA